MNISEWTFLTVGTELQIVEIEGTDVWMSEWRSLDIGTLEVPHPSYPHQRHKLWPYVVERGGQPVMFCAGELSNGVWCFYVPANGQPARTFKAMTVNERLYASNLLDAFDLAIAAREDKRAKDLLIATGLTTHQATETVATILKNPQAYGYRRHKRKKRG